MELELNESLSSNIIFKPGREDDEQIAVSSTGTFVSTVPATAVTRRPAAAPPAPC